MLKETSIANKAFDIKKSELTLNTFKSSELLDLISKNIHTYNNEDNLYYKPKDIKNWYYEWDFKEYNPNIYSHGFHQYPAKFIPQLARKLLRIFTDENSTVLDLFMGSGTTLIESMLLNRRMAIGIELNPFACFMAKIKTNPIHCERLNNTFIEIKTKFSTIKEFNLHTFYNIHFWFKEKQITDLSKLRFIIYQIEDEHIRDFFLLCMSEVVRRVSLTNHNGFKLHRDKNKLKDDFDPSVIWHFENIFNRNLSLMIQFYNKVKYSTTFTKIIENDARYLQRDIETNSVDFILTSPPYGDSKTTVAYGQFSRLSWQWIKDDKNVFTIDDILLGGNINNSNDNESILSTSKYLHKQYNEIKEKDEKRAKEVLTFYYDLFKSIQCAHSYLKHNKYFVLVTGNRTVKNVFLRTDLIISELANNLGFKTEKILYRNIINKRMPAKNSPTNKKGECSNTMLKENIIFLKKT